MIDIREIVKTCLMAEKFYSRTFGDVYYNGIITDDYGNFDAISCICYLGSERNKKYLHFNKFGQLSLTFGDLEIFTQECDLFFDKQCNDWNKIFKNGDVLYSQKTQRLYLVKGYISDHELEVHCQVDRLGFIDDFNLKIGTSNLVFAVPDQKEFLFSSLDKHNYKWVWSNYELVKKYEPIFEVDDYIKNGDGKIAKIERVGELAYHCYDGNSIRFSDQNKWKKLGNKYTRNFSHFQEVIVRDNDSEIWRCNIFSHYETVGDEENKVYKFACIDKTFSQCLPYNELTKKLINTTAVYENLF